MNSQSRVSPEKNKELSQKRLGVGLVYQQIGLTLIKIHEDIEEPDIGPHVNIAHIGLSSEKRLLHTSAHGSI